MPGRGSRNGRLFILLLFNFKSALQASLQTKTRSGHSTTILQMCAFIHWRYGHPLWHCSPGQHKSKARQLGKDNVPLRLRLMTAGAEDPVDPALLDEHFPAHASRFMQERFRKLAGSEHKPHKQLEPQTAPKKMRRKFQNKPTFQQ
uniref:Putative secreted protein n=1 Tax=Ixodes ricinus TaxID=34613 RepID=A0A6B0UUV5_IXORI